MVKRNPKQEILFDSDHLDPQELPAEMQDAATKDLATLEELTDIEREEIKSAQTKGARIPQTEEKVQTHREEAELEVIERLMGGSALSDEIRIADAEDFQTLEHMTDKELQRIEAILGQSRISRRDAENIVLGPKRAAKLNGEEYVLPTSSPKEQREKDSYPGRNPYKGKKRSGRHPKRTSPRVKTAGDANSGDPHLR